VTISRFSRWVTLPLGGVGGAVVFVLMAMTVVDIVLRKVSGQGIAGVIEYSEVLLVVAVFLSIAAAQANGYHVATTGFTSRLPRTARRIIELIGALAGAVIIVAMVFVAANAAWVSFQTGEYRMGIAHVVVWPARLAVAIGLLLYFVEFATGAVRKFRNPGADEPDELELAEKGLLP
jgi:TRAP-type C4-dicarboxylate transport system permease small subunit